MAVLSHDDGLLARTPEDAQQAEAAGYVQCATPKASVGPGRGNPCQFYISPETQSALQQQGGYYTCPSCHHSHDFLHEMPWHGVPSDEYNPDEFNAGGTTRIGLKMDVQGQIGEDLVQKLGEIPGYGPITWWHEGDAAANSPLDGATKGWGLEVKTLGYDATHHRFVPGRVKEKADKDQMAKRMGKQGVLGVLVLLDYRRSVADIYVREFPLERGIGTFRTSQGGTQKLVAEVPFKNPLMDPHDPSPHVDKKDDIPF